MAERLVWDDTFYTSATVTVNGNTGVIVTPTLTATGIPSNATVYPLCFRIAGAAMTVDETNDVTIDWYLDSGGLYTIGTTTFAQITWAALVPATEPWPGDVTLWNLSAAGASRTGIPLPPYHKISWTLGGTAKSMSFTIGISYYFSW